MKKLSILLVLGLFTLNAWSFPTDSVSTIYRNGEFISYCHVSVNASDSVSHTVINRFVNQMCYNLDALDKWGLKGMRLADSKNELLLFDFKSTTFNKKTSILRGTGDVIVPKVTRIPNLHVDTHLTQKLFSSGRQEVHLDLAGTNTFLKDLKGVCIYVPKGRNKTAYFVLESHIRFGWFFDMFVTQKRYKSILEWRLKQLLYNIKEEAEKKEKER